MDEAKRLELLQKDLDGALSPAEKAELARLLLQDPDAHRLRDDLKRTDRLLREVPEAEPPPGLRSAILRALGLEHRQRSSRSDGAGIFRRLSLPLAATIAGALVVVGLGYGLLNAGGEMGDLQGSVSATTSPPAPIDSVVVDAGGARISGRLYATDSGLRLELLSSSLEALEIRASYDSAALRPQAAPEGAGAAAGGFSVVLTPAEPRHSAEFTGRGPIRLEVHGHGQRLGSATLGEQPDG